jgi:cell division protein FtsL
MENIFQDNDNSQQLQNTIQTLMKSVRDKNIEIDELKKQLDEQQKNNEIYEKAKYLRSSNLDDNLYK